MTNMVLIYHALLKRSKSLLNNKTKDQAIDGQIKKVSILNIQYRRNPRCSGLVSVHCPEWCNWPPQLHPCYSWASLKPSSTSGNFCFWSKRVLCRDSLMDNIYYPNNQSALLPYVGPNKKKFANHFTAHVKCYIKLHYIHTVNIM